MENDVLFGGKIVLFGGDMAQIMPVMRGHLMDVVMVNALPAWEHWHRRQKQALTENRRAAGDPAFVAWLEKVRDGSANVPNTDDIIVPAEYLIRSGGHDVVPSRRYAEEQLEISTAELITNVCTSCSKYVITLRHIYQLLTSNPSLAGLW